MERKGKTPIIMGTEEYYKAVGTYADTLTSCGVPEDDVRRQIDEIKNSHTRKAAKSFIEMTQQLRPPTGNH